MTGRTRQTSEVTYKHEVADPHRVGGIPPAAEDLVVGVLRADVREALALPAAQQRAQPRPRRNHRRRARAKRAELARERSVEDCLPVGKERTRLRPQEFGRVLQVVAPVLAFAGIDLRLIVRPGPTGR